MGEFKRAICSADLKPGQACSVTIEGKDIALFNVNGAFFALDNTCPHRGGPLGEGDLADEIITCPWHGYEFNVKTGKVAEGGDMAAKTREVRVEGADVLVQID